MSKLFVTLTPDEEEEDDDYIPPPLTNTETLKRLLAHRSGGSEDEGEEHHTSTPPSQSGVSWLPPPAKKYKGAGQPTVDRDQSRKPIAPADSPNSSRHDSSWPTEMNEMPEPAAEEPPPPACANITSETLLEGYSDSSDEGEEGGGQDDGSETSPGAETTLSDSVKRQLGLKGEEEVQVTTLSASSLRDANWHQSDGAWSAKPTAEAGRLQKQRHQITWLAGRVVEDEKEIEAKAARMRDAKRQTRRKYGW